MRAASLSEQWTNAGGSSKDPVAPETLMRIAIAMRTLEPTDRGANDTSECFAEVEVDENAAAPSEDADDDDVQVTVVLRGKRTELENPALGVAELVLDAVKSRQRKREKSDVIDVAGVSIAQAVG